MSKTALLALTLFLAPGASLHAQPGQGAAASASATSYAPGSWRYRVTRESKSTQDMQGDVQSNTVTTIEELTLEIRPASRDSMRFTFTIDSASRQSDMPGAGETMAKGDRVTGAISPRGVVHGFDADTSAGEDRTSGFRNFLPYLPAGAMRAGTTWADTVSTPFSQNGIEGTSVSIVTSRVLGDTTIGSQKAWRIERSGTLSMSGTGNQEGTGLVLSGAGTASGMSYVGTNGVYLGARSTQDLTLNVQVPAAGLTIPIRQTTITTIEPIAATPR